MNCLIFYCYISLVNTKRDKNRVKAQNQQTKLGLTSRLSFCRYSLFNATKISQRGYCTPVTSAPQKQASTKPKQPLPPSIGNLDIRVGRIVHVERHPHADTLYVEKIDVGEPAPRTIISGLVKYMSLDDLKSKSVLVLCNLPSKEMRAIASHGMVLAASTTSAETGETKVMLVEPPQNSTPGEAVFVDGETLDILPSVSGNKLEKILKKCKVGDDGVATFTTSDGSSKPLQTASGPCTSSLKNASIS